MHQHSRCNERWLVSVEIKVTAPRWVSLAFYLTYMLWAIARFTYQVSNNLELLPRLNKRWRVCDSGCNTAVCGIFKTDVPLLLYGAMVCLTESENGRDFAVILFTLTTRHKLKKMNIRYVNTFTFKQFLVSLAYYYNYRTHSWIWLTSSARVGMTSCSSVQVKSEEVRSLGWLLYIHMLL